LDLETTRNLLISLDIGGYTLIPIFINKLSLINLYIKKEKFNLNFIRVKSITRVNNNVDYLFPKEQKKGVLDEVIDSVTNDNKTTIGFDSSNGEQSKTAVVKVTVKSKKNTKPKTVNKTKKTTKKKITKKK